MRGLVFPGNSVAELREFPDPVPGPHDAVIEMKASGMCGSDLHPYRAAPGGGQLVGSEHRSAPVIAGHEPCGVVVALGSAVSERTVSVGQRVMVHHYQGCGRCSHCRSGWQQLCQYVPVRVYGMNEHGGHAPYLKVPANTIVALPDAVTFASGAAISCGTGTAYGSSPPHEYLPGKDTIAIFVPRTGRPIGYSSWQRPLGRASSPWTLVRSGWLAPRSSAPTNSSIPTQPIRSPRSRT